MECTLLCATIALCVSILFSEACRSMSAGFPTSRESVLAVGQETKDFTEIEPLQNRC